MFQNYCWSASLISYYQCLSMANKTNSSHSIYSQYSLHDVFWLFQTVLNFSSLLCAFYFGTPLFYLHACFYMVLGSESSDYSCQLNKLFGILYWVDKVIILKGLSFHLFLIDRVWLKDGMMGEALLLQFFLSL